MTIRIDFGTLSATYLALLVFGIAFNYFVQWAESKGYHRGYLSLFVALGVLVTVSVCYVLIGSLIMVVIGAFIASGSPMILGSIYRYVREREDALKSISELAHD